MDASQRREHLLSGNTTTKPANAMYKIAISDAGLDDNIIKTTNTLPIIQAVGNLIRVDFLDGQVIYSSHIEFIQIDEVK